MKITVDRDSVYKDCPFLHGGDACYGAEERYCGADAEERIFPFDVGYPGEHGTLAEWCPLRGGPVTVELGGPGTILTGMRSATHFKAD